MGVSPGGQKLRMSDTSGTRSSGDVVSGALWMLLLGVLLSWVPILGPLVAGFVGGRLIASPRVALGIALVPALVMAGVLWAVLAAFDLPVVGAVAGFSALVIIAIQMLPLLAGAWFGGDSRAGGSAA